MKFNNREDVHNWALKALGKTVGELQALMPNKKTANKSIYGDAWESWFGVEKNNLAEADLGAVGIELKATPLKKVRYGITAKERLVLNKINYITEFELNNVNESNFYKKNQVLEIGFYLYEKGIKNTDFKFIKAMQFKVPDKDWLIIKKDWELIHKYIKEGKANDLSGSLTNILEACTKAKKATDITPQHPSLNVGGAKPRAFALKNSYMQTLVRDYIYGDKVDPNIQVDYFNNSLEVKNNRESIVTDYRNLENQSLEEIILSKIDKYKGKSTTELANLFSINTNSNPKHLQSMIIKSLLGIRNNPEETEEFSKAGIQVKTIRLEEENIPEQHMSFPSFEFEELVSKSWHESDLFNQLEQTKFLFVVFKNIKGQYILKGAKFWAMPVDVIESQAKSVWSSTKKIIKDGVKLERVPWGNNWRIENNLPKVSDKGSIMHVRPHTSQSSYVESPYSSRLPVKARWKNKPEDFSDNYMTKQCFWLNRDFISKQVEEFWD
ncbi:TPA: Sau3AI family type II restriction endonuclease [Streptococcus agalactiae]